MSIRGQQLHETKDDLIDALRAELDALLIAERNMRAECDRIQATATAAAEALKSFLAALRKEQT